MLTRLMAQYNGIRPISLVYVSKPLITVTQLFALSTLGSDHTNVSRRYGSKPTIRDQYMVSYVPYCYSKGYETNTMN